MKLDRESLINLIVRDEYTIKDDDYSHLYKRKELNNWTTDKLFDECLERGLVYADDRVRVTERDTNNSTKV